MMVRSPSQPFAVPVGYRPPWIDLVAPLPTIRTTAAFEVSREIAVREYYREVMDAYHRYLHVRRRILRAWSEPATRALAVSEKKEEEEANLTRNEEAQ